VIYIIIGASRGLGKALVEECLRRPESRVIGTGRTSEELIAENARWRETGRYDYHQLDIADASANSALRAMAGALPQEPVCIIFNAAIIASDFTIRGDFSKEAYDKVNGVTIGGFGNMLDAFGAHLYRNRGMVIGISSLSAVVPLHLEPMIAYPASKAFLITALRSLRLLWGRRVRIVTVLLGHVGDRKFSRLSGWLVPSYGSVAKRILGKLERSFPPSTVSIPLVARAAYTVFNLFPDAASQWIFRFIRHRLHRLNSAKQGEKI
jgi:NAD(P)-dependent dehydrogenase (short-subunit alcohol dehydrogenase family)